MRGRFTDKVAVVTGGNSGIGLATAKAFVREGARVAITGRSDTTLKAAQKELGPDALVIKADDFVDHTTQLDYGTCQGLPWAQVLRALIRRC